MYDTVKVRVWPDTVNNLGAGPLALTELKMYPNPAFNEVVFEGAEGYSVGIFDLAGRCVVSSVIATKKEILQIAQLANGLYFVKMTKTVNGEVVNKRLVKE